MTTANIDRLAAHGTAAFATGPIAGLPGGRIGDELRHLLTVRNGFFLYDDALLVRGSGHGRDDLEQWNAQDNWRGHYGGLADDAFFFAENGFGGQFAIAGDGVIAFDPETGARHIVATT